MSKIIFVPDNTGYLIKYIDDAGNPKYLGKVPNDYLPTAMWFYRLDGMEMEIIENNMNDSIDDYFEQKFSDFK